MNFSDIANLVSQYSGASAAQPPANTERDFQQVAGAVPQEHLAGGLAQAFQSNETPAFGQMLGSLFQNSNGEQKAGILNRLLSAAGGSALTSGILGSVAQGGLGQMFGAGQAAQTTVTPSQAEQVPPEAVTQLAEHAKQQNPSVVQEASQFYAQHPTLVQALGAGSLALILSHISKKS